MKKIISILIITIISVQFLSAQHGMNYKKRKEKIKAQRVAFITDKLDLTADEAAKFWPVYNEFNKKKDAIMIERRKCMRSIMQNNDDDITNEKAVVAADDFIKTHQKETDLIVEYHEKFKKVLPIQKVAKLYQAEKLFKRELLHNLKKGQCKP